MPSRMMWIGIHQPTSDSGEMMPKIVVTQCNDRLARADSVMRFTSTMTGSSPTAFHLARLPRLTDLGVGATLP